MDVAVELQARESALEAATPLVRRTSPRGATAWRSFRELPDRVVLLPTRELLYLKTRSRAQSSRDLGTPVSRWREGGDRLRRIMRPAGPFTI